MELSYAISEDVGIVMSDGTRLSARIWMPDSALTEPVPAILEYLPYRKRDGTADRDALTHPFFVTHGYACVRVDIRGNGESEGLMTDEYTETELRDACEVIAWLRDQPWCSGSIGMMGISWGGFNALQVAWRRPPGLDAIVTLCSTVDRYADDIHYKGGCLLGENFGWASTMLSYSSRPPDPALVGEKWLEMWKSRLDSLPFLIEPWLRHQLRDGYWRHGSVCEDYGAIQTPTLAIGGWHDGYRNTVAHLVENLEPPTKGIVGPWIHKYPHFAKPEPAIGFLQVALRWWDRWLKGIPNGAEHDPDMRLFELESLEPARWHDERPGRWVAHQTWGEPDTKTLFLAGQALANEPGPVAAAVSSPQRCGQCCGEYFPMAFGPELPADQTDDDRLSVCFDSDVLDAGVTINGRPEATMTVSADVDTAFLALRLCDVRPDGTSALISHGFLNLTHRFGHDRVVPIDVGSVFEITVPLDHAAYTVPAGHRLRLALSTTYWPFVWPSPTAASVVVTAGQVTLPVRAGDGEWRFEPPTTAPPRSVVTRREPSNSKTVTSTDGSTVTEIVFDFGEVEDVEHGLVAGERCHERWSIGDDPLSARVDIDWRQVGGRPGSMWSTDTRSTMTSDADSFHVTAVVLARLEGEVFATREFEATIPREGV
ncbi:MAG: CocE/NonD family hydrolase [Acidimicrobiia bacterium]|nr:CocE/NonD family hydrolase [Acidimicrobiia bacterium]MDH4306996.1 CocE/NonD family hydrolase [Acidimicrobiia bacterium]